MGLFGKPKDERKELKKQVDNLMRDYDKEKIDGDTYFKKNDGPNIILQEYA